MEGDKSVINSPIFFVMGPTGSGKSHAAVKVAKTLHDRCGYENVVIINCDVMQFYEGLPIATNKVSSTEMENIPHLFLGFLDVNGEKVKDPTLPYSGCDKSTDQGSCSTTGVSQENRAGSYNIHSFVRDVVAFTDSFFKQNPSAAIVVCGGTCYYAQALLFENLLTTEDDDDDDAKLLLGKNDKNLVEEREGKTDWETLNKIDPVIASRYHPKDQRRIERLLEIHRKTGRLPSEIFSTRKNPSFRFPPERCFIFITWPHIEDLKNALDDRVDKMVSRGLVEEFCEFIRQRGASVSSKALGEAIGFKEFFSAFDIHGINPSLKGQLELKESIDQIKCNTRRYARQQRQWLSKFFSGKFREVFISHQGERNLLTFNSSTSLPIFLETVESVTKLCVKNQQQSCSSDILSFPLEQDAKPRLLVMLEWCPLCNVMFCASEDLSMHLSSKRHRGAVRHANLVRHQKEYYGRDIPPKKRSAE